MSSRGHPGQGSFDVAGRLTPAVRGLIVANGIIFLAEIFLQKSFPDFERVLGLVPADVFARGRLWQLVTYLFLHGDVFHILFNMFALFMFGSELEGEWGSREFLKYYFFTGIGAGLCTWAVGIHSPIPTIGASGAIFGILLAFGLMYPTRPVLLFFVLPIPAGLLVVLFGVLELVMAIGRPADGIARFAHLGGLLFGLIYLKSGRFLEPIRRGWRARAGEQDARRRTSERAEIDAILEKISREGTGSLTRQEKKKLEEAARRGRAGRRP